ncbi:MAG TPA: NHL repeat-containing protein [Terracidiphilus sp.]|nr:NHL repeat-containing protein [Terracidiphilus sp.]
MQATLRGIRNSLQSGATGTAVALAILFALSLGVNAATAQAPPIVVTGPSTLIGDMHFSGAGGGWFSGQAPLGGTFVVGVNGDVIVGAGYGSGVFQITPGGTQSVLANFGNSNAAGMDQYGNAYIARDYGDSIIKLPFVSGQYVGFTGGTPTTNCQGGTQDATPCVFAPNVKSFMDGVYASSNNPGFTSLLFDAQGNFFFATDTTPGNSGLANTIYECSVKCQTETDGAGTYPPVAVYADPGVLGAVAVDPWGNLFFSDGQGNLTGKKTYVEELPFSSGKYASAPTVITTYTSSSDYNGISGVTASNLTTIYFTIPNDGVYAIPNSSSGPNAAGIYKVSNLGGKGMALDAAGDIYLIQYSGTLNNDGVFVTAMGNVGFGASPVGTATAATAITVIDSAGNCTSAPTLAFSATSEYAVTPPASGSCSVAVNTAQGSFTPALASNGASFSASIVFTPAQAGLRSSVLTTSDSGNSASGYAALRGVGQAPAANVDPGVMTTFSTGLTAPASIVADAAGDVFIADPGAAKVYEIAHGGTTPAAIGSGFSKPDALALDANGDLFIADNGTFTVEIIPNTGSSGSFTAGTQATVISTSDLFGNVALGSATGLAFGPRGTLYISDPANNRVVYFNQITGQAGVTLLNASNSISIPMGLATDSGGSLYVADSGLDAVVQLAGGVTTTISTSSVTDAIGVAVDGSGSVFIADGSTGNIVRVPNLSGTLTTSSAATVEALGSPASSLWADAAGDLYAASPSTKSAYAVQRSAASIDLGIVEDGQEGTGTVYLMNSGNQAATLADPDVTEPTNTLLTLNPAATNGCGSGSGPAGALCSFTAAFAPPAGSGDSGPYSGTGSILIATPALTIPVSISATASTSTLKAQTITFNPAPPAAGYIGQEITLSATATSGLTVTFSTITPNVCNVTGTTATFNTAGTCTIDANQAGDTTWGAAPQVNVSITIAAVTPAGVPGLVMTQLSWLNPTGSFSDGQNPQGGSFAVTTDGKTVVIGTTYSNKVYFVDAQTGATIGTPVAVNGPGGITVDSSNNLYISHLYNNVVYKIPYVNGAWVAWSDNPSPAPAACTGTDTAECTFVTYPSGAPNSGGLKALAFDPSGNFYMVSEPDSSNSLTGQSNIYECDTTCQPAGTGTVLYADPNGVSQIAFDSWGNLFFTDSNFDVSGANDVGNSGASSSNLNELVFTSGTGFASQPTILQTFANNGGGANYDNMLASVAVDPTSGTIYYGVLYDGLFAIPNTQGGGPQVDGQYAVSTQGAKALQAGLNGSLFLVANTNGADTVGFMAVSNLTTPSAQYQGPAVTGSASVVDNAAGYCPNTAPNLLFASDNPTEFSATAGTTCGGIGMGDATLKYPLNGTFGSASSYPVTITFTPLNLSSQSATLSISDATNGGTGSAKVTGFANATPQTLAFTAPTTTTSTYAPGLTVTVSVTNGGSNNPAAFSVDSGSGTTGAGTFSTATVTGTTSTATLTVTQAGAIVINANEPGGLVNGVYYNDATQTQLTLTVNKAAQTLTFAPQTAPVTYAPGLTINLSATPGVSTSPVVFSVDSGSGTTGAGTISGSVLTVTQAGNIVVDADQAADADYLAATQVQQPIVVNPASQAIAFTPPSAPIHFIVGGITVPVAATGGASGNPVVFTVDKSSTANIAAISGSILTVTGTGTVVVDADQASTANYSAAPQAQETIAILAALPTQTITFDNPGTQVAGTPLTLAATASSGMPVSFASTTTDVCTVASSGSTWTATIVTAGNCTIIATQLGDNTTFAAAPPVSQTFIVNATGVIPNIGLGFTLSTLTISPGTNGLTSLTVASKNAFAGTVSFACSGLPSGYSCTFNPNPITVQANASATTNLTIGGATSGANRNSQPMLPEAALAVALCWLGFRKRNRFQMLLLVLIGIVGLGLFSGCGGSSKSTTSTPATSKVTITATSGAVSQSATLTLTVE